MGVTQQTGRRIAKLSLVALSLVATLRCNVYNESLLGRDALAVGGTGSIGHSGGHTATGGAGPGGAPASGAANAGFGGLDEMSGAMETGGTETNGGAGGSISAGGADGGTGGASAGTAGIAVGGGTGGGGGSGGSGGANQTASGCAKLSVPLDDANDKAHFVISLASTADLSAATIIMHYYVQQGQGGTLFNYVQDSGTFHFLGVAAANRQPLTPGGWSTTSWNVGAEPDAAGTGIVKTSIKSIGIEINAQPSSTWTNPTVVYVDSLTVQTPTLSFTFDAASSVSTSNTAGALWLNGGSSDTTATGVTLSWQAACP